MVIIIGMPGPLWTPSSDRVARANLTRFMRFVADRGGVVSHDYSELYPWSVRKPDEFWDVMWEFAGVRGDKGSRVTADLDRMPGARFFPDATLNFAENVLRGAESPSESDPAVIHTSEVSATRTLSWGQLRTDVAACAAALRAAGIGPGDRVAAYLPNTPEAIVGVLGAASVGAVWSSCSPDFGVQGVLDRFGQIEPRMLIAADRYVYAGRTFDQRPKIAEVVGQLPTLTRTLVGHAEWEAFIAPHRGATPSYAALPFNHPLYILYSSGTTGVPKCIVHGAGGTLIQHLKEHQLHCDVKPGDRVFHFTTLGWMMWNWLVTVLASGATILLYDGAPFHPGGNALFTFADETGMTLFGTSAKYIDTVQKAGLTPIETHQLETVRTMTSTGSPLAPESFDFVYTKIKRDLHLASMSGGTDIISCFAGGNPIAPVWRGELQTRGLGMRVEVFDEQGRSIHGERGELVCTMPFPSMPVRLWNDPDGPKYRAGDFETYPNVWRHGDWTKITDHGGLVIYGRSDATLNPGGVRIGTAEIYRQVEQLPEIVESIVVGQDVPGGAAGDVRIVLFVRLAAGQSLTAELKRRIQDTIRQNTSPHHVPKKIVAVSDIPRTISGKITELAVREVIHGRPVKNVDALANPAALELFRNLPELAGE